MFHRTASFAATRRAFVDTFQRLELSPDRRRGSAHIPSPQDPRQFSDRLY
jgi:hypothetical protein